MKKILLILAATASLFACQQKPAQNTVTTQQSNADAQFPVAYVNVDSIMANYNYATALAAKFEKEGKGKQSELQTKAEKFQRRAIDFQKKVQQHLITSVQAEKMQKQLMKEEQNLGVLQQKMQQEMAFQEREMLLMLNDSLIAALNEINKDEKYKMILRNSLATQSIIVASKDVDLTAQTIDLLNKRYAEVDTTKVK